MPAHHTETLHPLVDEVLLHLFPELEEREKIVEARQREIDCSRGDTGKIRSEEQMSDVDRLLRSIRFSCRMALLCIVARPRSWKQWSILQDETSVWKRGVVENHRVVVTLFAGCTPAIEAMNRLADAVFRHEEAEISSRLASPDNSVETAVVNAVKEIGEKAAQREAKHFSDQKIMLERLFSMMSSTQQEKEETKEETKEEVLPSPSAFSLEGCRVKNKRKTQEDVVYFSTWKDVGKAIEYAKNELAPLEREDGASWRIIKLSDGREDKSRDKQWRCYRTLAVSVGLLLLQHFTYEDAVSKVQDRLDRLGDKAHTPLIRELNEEQKSVKDSSKIAKSVLDY